MVTARPICKKTDVAMMGEKRVHEGGSREAQVSAVGGIIQHRSALRFSILLDIQ